MHCSEFPICLIFSLNWIQRGTLDNISAQPCFYWVYTTASFYELIGLNFPPDSGIAGSSSRKSQTRTEPCPYFAVMISVRKLPVQFQNWQFFAIPFNSEPPISEGLLRFWISFAVFQWFCSFSLEPPGTAFPVWLRFWNFGTWTGPRF